MNNTPDKELDAFEAAVLCDVHINTIWRWINTGKLPACRKETAKGRKTEGKGVAWIIKASDLAKIMEERKGGYINGLGYFVTK